MACRYLEDGSPRFLESGEERCEESGCDELVPVPVQRGVGVLPRSLVVRLDFAVELHLALSIDVAFVDTGSWIVLLS